MSTKEEIELLFNNFNKALIDVDIPLLEKCLSDDFKIILVTGLPLTREEYINYIKNGTFKTYEISELDKDINITKDFVKLVTHSKFITSLYGKKKEAINMTFSFDCYKENGKFEIARIITSQF